MSSDRIVPNSSKEKRSPFSFFPNFTHTQIEPKTVLFVLIKFCSKFKFFLHSFNFIFPDGKSRITLPVHLGSCQPLKFFESRPTGTVCNPLKPFQILLKSLERTPFFVSTIFLVGLFSMDLIGVFKNAEFGHTYLHLLFGCRVCSLFTYM